ncbi:hypothetical protein OEA41_009820 [Lepraria neglecta]|uniref:Delta(24)-sterol reductase n=1 Tax=Lepraria neglecta TaxID=209136 RepID=A0AAD9YW59_9LECA|nr:hypothetical protein OEA41_009820 [Lepraria neglecta]
MDHHDQAVAVIVARVRRLCHEKQAFRIYGATNPTRKTSFRPDRAVDTSKLSRVLDINLYTKTAIVEPNVSMGHLVKATLTQGLLPPVVPEFPGITVGGAFSGIASDKCGFFDKIVIWIQIVLANGQIVFASRKGNADLFYGAAGSFDPNNDYVDAIQFDKSQGVIITGRLTNAPCRDIKTQRFSRAEDPWFYPMLRKCSTSALHPGKKQFQSPTTSFATTEALSGRQSQSSPTSPPPFNDFTRWATDNFMHTKTLYHQLHENGMAKDNVIQDLALPVSQAQTYMEWLDVDYAIYPLWLCPIWQSQQKCMNPHTPELVVSKNNLNGEERSDSSRELLISIGV